MAVLVQQAAPQFKAQAVMPDNSFQELSLEDYKGKYVLFYFYPLDFTFVCPTEIIAFSDRIDEFEALGVQVVGCSIDSHFSHLAWRNTPRSEGGIGQIKYPLVADLNKQIAKDYDVLIDAAGIALRGLFLIDKDGVVRHQVVNDLPLGRSVDEAPADGQSAAVLRRARRGLPRQLARRLAYNQSRPGEFQRVLQRGIRGRLSSARQSHETGWRQVLRPSGFFVFGLPLGFGLICGLHAIPKQGVEGDENDACEDGGIKPNGVPVLHGFAIDDGRIHRHVSEKQFGA